MKTMINISNHPSTKWSQEQTNAALSLCGSIVDYSFPNVDPNASEMEILTLARRIVADIVSQHGDQLVCLVQGEFCLTFCLIQEFHAKNIICLAATSIRQVVETIQTDGSTKKDVIFSFCQFRSYFHSDRAWKIPFKSTPRLQKQHNTTLFWKIQNLLSCSSHFIQSSYLYP